MPGTPWTVLMKEKKPLWNLEGNTGLYITFKSQDAPWDLESKRFCMKTRYMLCVSILQRHMVLSERRAHSTPQALALLPCIPCKEPALWACPHWNCLGCGPCFIPCLKGLMATPSQEYESHTMKLQIPQHSWARCAEPYVRFGPQRLCQRSTPSSGDLEHSHLPAPSFVCGDKVSN